MKIFSFALNSKTVSIHIAWLLTYNIDKTKYTGSFIFTFALFISISNKSSEKYFVVGSETS